MSLQAPKFSLRWENFPPSLLETPKRRKKKFVEYFAHQRDSMKKIIPRNFKRVPKRNWKKKKPKLADPQIIINVNLSKCVRRVTYDIGITKEPPRGWLDVKEREFSSLQGLFAAPAPRRQQQQLCEKGKRAKGQRKGKALRPT